VTVRLRSGAHAHAFDLLSLSFYLFLPGDRSRFNATTAARKKNGVRQPRQVMNAQRNSFLLLLLLLLLLLVVTKAHFDNC
jgi:hypothetical protein